MTARRLSVIIGVVAILAGLLFMAQGSGLFPYPRASFMIDQRPWIWRGAGLVILGTLAVFVARRRI